MRNHEPHRFYTLYGLDIKHSSTSQYCVYRSFAQERNSLNHVGAAHSQVAILRDKFLFFTYAKALGLQTPEVFALIVDGTLRDANMRPTIHGILREERDYFVKSADGECASFVNLMAGYDDFLAIFDRLNDGNYILQRRLVQCDRMNQLNPGALNTLRVVTVYNGGKPYVLSSVLRVGTAATGRVDNWSVGGLAIGVDESGCLKEYGFFKPGFGTRTDRHPDTGVQFRHFTVPFYEQALALACTAHERFYGIHSIGWDIAMTSEGATLLEGNDNWEMSLMQACNGGLAAQWTAAIAQATNRSPITHGH